MVLHTLARGYSPTRLLQLDHPVLSRQAVLCAKLLATFWLLTGQVVYLRADVTPFGGVALPFVHALPWVQLAMFAQLLAILTILCSTFVRAGCAALSLMIVGLCLIDQPLFSNNRAFCAALLCMLAIDGSATLKLARAQAALVYLCAALDKALDLDWRSGVFLRSFFNDLCRTGELWSPGWSPGAPLPLTCALSAWLQTSIPFAVVLSACVIATELLIGVGYARHARYTAPLAVTFHCALFVLTGSTFGVFFYAGLACAVLAIDLEHMPRPFQRAWPYFTLAVVMAGPWVRPWHAPLLVLAGSAWMFYAWRQQRSQMSPERR